MFERLCRRARQLLLSKLRPGRDRPELLKLIGRAEAVQSDELRSMLERLVDFSDLRVREVMVPRLDMQAIGIDLPLADAARRIVDSGYTRLPVYERDLDHICGIVHAWDVFSAQAKSETPSLGELLRPCPKVPETQLAFGLLSRMQQDGSHMAILLDEYGGTAGLVTLSALLSEIVGSMDEAVDAEDEEECVRQPDGDLTVLARMHVEELEEALGRPLPHGDFDTVGGLISSETGRIPVAGECLQVAGLTMHILDASPRRLHKVRIEQGGTAET